MSIFAGIYHLDRDRAIVPEWRERLRKCVSRHPDNEVREFQWRAAYVVHVDVGAYGYPSVSETDGLLTALAGQLIWDHRPLADRRHEGRALGADLAAGRRSVLRSARGTFAALVYDPVEHRLWLTVDRVGIRPIYWWSDGNTVVFASALRILEALADLLRLELDLVGTAEMLAFGFALGARTPYRQVCRLRPAELITAGQGAVERERWFRWDEIAQRPGTEKADLQELYARFREAVVLRAGTDRTVRAFLSGGLDSRCIVSILSEVAERVHTYNFSWPGTYDQVLAAQFADRCGTVHHESPLFPQQTGDAWPRLIAQTLAKAPPFPPEAPGHERVVWSGDGGSVGVGRVYLDRSMVELMRTGRHRATVDVFLRRNLIGVPVGFLLTQYRERLAEMPARGMAAELEAMACAEPGQKLFVFLLENDQRWHLAHFYEDMDVNRIEYLMPFFDAEFLSASASFKLDAALGHAMYNRWLKCFPKPVWDVPWQAYPGHEPCPMPLPEGYSTQWAASRHRSKGGAFRECVARLRCVWEHGFPNRLLSRQRYVVACFADLVLGPRYAYAFSVLWVFLQHARRCAAPVSVPEAQS